MKRVMIFQPTYWPSLYLVHRMAHAEVVLVMDEVQFRRRKLKEQSTWVPHNRCELPSGSLTVSVKHGDSGERQIYKDLVCTTDGWQSKHIHELSAWYPSYAFNLKDVLSLIANFPISYTAGCMAIYYYLQSILPTSCRIVRQSQLRSQNSTGVALIRDLCLEVHATHYITGRSSLESYLEDGQPLLEAGIGIYVQDLQFPNYAAQSNGHWSVLDIIAQRSASGTNAYLRTLQDVGWEQRKG